MRTKQKQKTECLRKAMFVLAVAMLFSVLTSILVSAQISIVLNSQTNPLEHGFNQTINVTITSNASIVQAKIEFTGQNYTLMNYSNFNNSNNSNGSYVNSYYYTWSPALGNNNYTIYAENVNSEMQSLFSQFSVQDTSGPLTIGFGPNGYLQNQLVEIKIITNENSTCRYDISDMSYSSMRYNLTGNATEHVELKTLGDGTYNYYAKCKDRNSNEGLVKNLQFTIDTVLPQLSFIGPVGIQTQNTANLRFTTTEQATCKWSSSITNYASMQNTFSITGGVIHDHQISLVEGLNPHHVICQDLSGNKNLVYSVNVEYNNPPSAKVYIQKIDGYESLKVATYRVDLVSSKPLSQTPTLSLSCSGKNIKIPLQGSSKDWFGYLIIDDGSLNCAGEFNFQGIDQKGAIGTVIDDGKLVIVDSRKPRMPINLKAIIENNKIRLSWVDESSVGNYKIYRSTTGNTDQNNFKASSSQTIYTDQDIQHRVGYFYRVSSISKSGVESDLSEEIFLMANLNQTQQFIQDPQIENLLNAEIDYTQRIVNEIDLTLVKIEDDSSIENKILSKLNAKQQLESSKSNLQSLIGELRIVLETRISYEEASQKTKTIRLKSDSEKRKIIMKIDVLESSDKELLANDLFDLQAVSLPNLDLLSSVQKDSYIDELKSINEKSRINQKIAKYRISMFDGSQRDGLYLSKKIISTEDPLSIWVQEIIPSELIKISQTIFSPAPDDINQLGPIWKARTLVDGELSYLYELDNSNQVKIDEINVETLLIRDVDAFIVENNLTKDNGITGNVIQNPKNDSTLIYLTVLLGLVLAGLVGYYFVFTGNSNGLLRNSNFEDASYVELLSLLADARLSLASGDLDSAYQTYADAHSKYSDLKIGVLKKMKLNLEFHNLHEDLKKESSLNAREAETKHLYS